MDSSLPTLVARARRAWNRALALSLIGTSLGLTLALAGAAILTGRVLGADVAPAALAAALVAAAVLAVRRFGARRVDDDQMATLLDLRSGGSGALLHARAHGDDPAALPALDQLTRPRTEPRRVLRVLLPALVFLAATLAVPPRVAAVAPAERLAEQRLDELAELAQQLEEVLDLDEELEAEVQENLESTREGMDEQELTGEALMEALDQLEQRLDEVAEQAAEQLQGARDELAQAEAGMASGVDPQDLAEQLDQLAQELADLGALPEGTDLSDLSSLSPGDLARELDQAALERLRQMARSGLLDGSRLAQGGQPGLPSFMKPRPLPGGS